MKLTLPADWSEHGARWGADGLLYLPDWRRGFTVHELRAMFFESQQVRRLNADLRQRERDIAAMQAQIDALARRAAFYRAQVVLEARLGLLLARIAA